MKRATVRFTSEEDEQLYDRISELADERDRSISYLLVEAARQVYGEGRADVTRTDAPRTASERVAPKSVGDIKQRIADLEARVDALESNGPLPPEFDVTARVQGVEFRREIARSDEREAALVEVYRELAERAPLPKSDVLDIYDEYNADLSETSWYEGLVAALGDLPEFTPPGQDNQFWRFHKDRISEPLNDE